MIVMVEQGNRLREAVISGGEFSWEHDFVEKARANPLYTRVMKEAVLSDISGALGYVHELAIEASRRMAVGRDIIWVLPTKQSMVRFYLAEKGKVWRIADGPPLTTGERFNTVDISVDREYGYDALFSQSYIEDVPFDVIQSAIADATRLLEEQITLDIRNLYEGIPAANLAGGAEISASTSGTLTWKDIVTAVQKVRAEGWNPNVAIVHPDQVADLFNDEKFINGFYPSSEGTDIERGILGGTYLGVKIVETDIFTSTKCHVLDTTKAAVLLMRRDITTQPYEIPEKLLSGALCSIRYGLGTLRENAVARITNC